MRLTALSTLFALSLAACCASAQADGLKHNWREMETAGAVTFVSNYRAPKPFSATGEPEATLTMEASEAPAGKTLAEIVKDEVADIRDEGLIIADYAEADGHKPDNNIATYFQEIDGQQVAFIKYRIAGNTNGVLAKPRSVIHALLLKGEKLYFLHLIVVYAGHQDEVRADQVEMVRTLIRR